MGLYSVQGALACMFLVGLDDRRTEREPWSSVVPLCSNQKKELIKKDSLISESFLYSRIFFYGASWKWKMKKILIPESFFKSFFMASAENEK